jgi:hypothetical protein
LATSRELPADFHNPTITVRIEGSTRTYEKKEFSCNICQDDLEPGENVINHVECNNQFHAHCISHWIFLNMACPICRIQLFL